MRVNFSPRFKRAYKKVPPHIQSDFGEKMVLFTQNPYHPSLKTHKLTGKLQECLGFYLRDGYRVLFEFTGPNTVDLLIIGPHDIYKRF